MRKKINTSLSAKVKRRNAQGFSGLGNHTLFLPKTHYGKMGPYLKVWKNILDLEKENVWIIREAVSKCCFKKVTDINKAYLAIRRKSNMDRDYAEKVRLNK